MFKRSTILDDNRPFCVLSGGTGNVRWSS